MRADGWHGGGAAHADQRRLNIAIVGSGISGLSAAWLLARRHDVTVFEADSRLGGHSHTVMAGGTPVDTGFIVYNERTYPNLTALFAHLGVPVQPTAMTFAISLDRGRLEYSGTNFWGLIAQRRNLIRPRFWLMMRDVFRFYREALIDLPGLGEESLDAYLALRGYSEAFRTDHLYPMAAAIWSTPVAEIGAYPAAAFIRFCDNHTLLEAGDRPLWQTVKGGACEYIARLTADFASNIRLSTPVRRITRGPDGVQLTTDAGPEHFDEVVIAAHADQALAMLGDPDEREEALLGAFQYRRNEAVLHSDAALMPRRRRAWSAWNYLAEGKDGRSLSVTYWMNALQHLPSRHPLFVTLNPIYPVDPAKIIRSDIYHHPIFDAAAMRAQQQLWSLQGRRHTWFCGAHFGSGFHEDGLQSGLAVAEQLGGAMRPWSVAEPSGRIFVTTVARPSHAVPA